MGMPEWEFGKKWSEATGGGGRDERKKIQRDKQIGPKKTGNTA